MNESTGKIKIGFTYVDEFGNTWSSESQESLSDEFGSLDIIGRQFDTFLRQAGYIRNGDTVFMDSVTDEECEVLHTALENYRNKNLNGGK